MRSCIIPIVLVVLFGCKKDNVPPTYNFTNEDREWLIYNVNDIFLYKSLKKKDIESYRIFSKLDTVLDVTYTSGTSIKAYDAGYYIKFKCLDSSGRTIDSLGYQITFVKNSNGFGNSIYWSRSVCGSIFTSQKTDTLNINGIKYSDVYKLQNCTYSCDTVYSSPRYGSFLYVYYAKKTGIIRFETCDGDTWDLVK